MRCTKQPVSSARVLDFLLPDIGPNYPREWKERLERFSADFRWFQAIPERFVYPSTAGSTELGCPEEGRGRKKRVNDIRERQRGCTARLVKEFSAGCGTRSFLGDDVLKFTVGVRSSLLLTGILGSLEPPQAISTRFRVILNDPGAYGNT